MDVFLAAFPTFRADANDLATYLDALALATGPGLFLDGTLAAPGVAFASDTDTGFRRTGGNALAVVTGGADRLLVNSAGAALTGLLSGTAVTQSATDATAGRLLTVGAFGLGVVGSITTLAALDITTNPTGQYRTIDTTTGTFPSGVSVFGYLTIIRYDSANIAQTYTPVGSVTGANSRYTRTYNNSTSSWLPWRQVYNQGNILGTVSQTAGVPTGAIIERGSNANGEYVRWADGTQICTKNLTGQGPISTTVGTALFQSSNIVIGTMASTFIAAPNRHVGSHAAAGVQHSWASGVDAPTTTAGGQVILLSAATSAATDFVVTATFVGRWF